MQPQWPLKVQRAQEQASASPTPTLKRVEVPGIKLEGNRRKQCRQSSSRRAPSPGAMQDMPGLCRGIHDSNRFARANPKALGRTASKRVEHPSQTTSSNSEPVTVREGEEKDGSENQQTGRKDSVTSSRAREAQGTHLKLTLHLCLEVRPILKAPRM